MAVAEKRRAGSAPETTYAFRSLLDAGASLAFGRIGVSRSPWKKSNCEHLRGAVTRRTLEEKTPNGWVPEQKITLRKRPVLTLSVPHTLSSRKSLREPLHPQASDLVMLSRMFSRLRPERLKT